MADTRAGPRLAEGECFFVRVCAFAMLWSCVLTSVTVIYCDLCDACRAGRRRHRLRCTPPSQRRRRCSMACERGRGGRDARRPSFLASPLYLRPWHLCDLLGRACLTNASIYVAQSPVPLIHVGSLPFGYLDTPHSLIPYLTFVHSCLTFSHPCAITAPLYCNALDDCVLRPFLYLQSFFRIVISLALFSHLCSCAISSPRTLQLYS